MPPAVRRAQTPLCRHVEAPDQPSPHRSKDDVGSSFACGGDSPWVVSDMTDFLLSQCFIADICLFCSAFFFHLSCSSCNDPHADAWSTVILLS
jgi:hypothetical protein